MQLRLIECIRRTPTHLHIFTRGDVNCELLIFFVIRELCQSKKNDLVVVKVKKKVAAVAKVKRWSTSVFLRARALLQVQTHAPSPLP